MPESLRVLILEDSAQDAELMVRELRRGGFDPHWERVSTREAFCQNLRLEWDVILSDFQLPGFDGLSAMELVKARGLAIPFIIVSGFIDEETAVQAMKHGAADYLLKDRLARLVPAIEQALEQARLQRNRRLAAERLRLATEAAQVGIWELDLVHGKMEWDAQMHRLYGLAPGADCDVVAHAFGIIHPADVSRVRKEFEEAQSGAGAKFDTEFRISRPDDGQTHFIRATATVIRSATGEPERMVGINWDVTEERVRERNLSEALALEKELADKARAGDRAKSEFLAVMSHEVRTPLNGIIGFADLLSMSTSLSPKHSEYAKIITKSGEALLRILDDILDFSRLEAGRMQIVRAPFQPRALFRDIQNLVAPQAAGKNLKVTMEVGAGVPEFLEGDSARLRQILLNLAGNAIKFTDKGGVSIGLKFLPEQPSTFVFTVKDTGVGIAAGQIERIFEPFTQADSSISRKYGGTGLGLAISRRLAHLLEGNLSVKSRPGEGSEFSLTVRMSQAAASQVDFSPAPDSLDSGFASRHPLSILVVEDDEINMKLIQVLLRRLGYQPFCARDGREAVEVFEQVRPDFILMDLQMPEMDGIEATEAIRRLEAAGGGPVYISALTANIFPADRQKCLEAGMNDYINKPVKISALAEALTRADALNVGSRA